MQDPSTVATLLVNAARNYNIYFAIPAILEFSWRFWKINYCETRLKYLPHKFLMLLLLTACVEENNRYPRLEYVEII